MLTLIRTPLVSVTLLSLTAFPSSASRKIPGKHKLIFPASSSKKLHAAKEIAWMDQFSSWQLERAGISANLFRSAIRGFIRLSESGQLLNNRLLTLVDFSKPSTKERLFVIDLLTGKILYKTLVAHGRNSGTLFARNFSNNPSSYASSPGFYITGTVYNGKHGVSLRLRGCEKGINDLADERAIVLHGAPYVSRDFIDRFGFLGRSQGCPAVPEEWAEPIIKTIHSGSCLFVYTPQVRYHRKSAFAR